VVKVSFLVKTSKKNQPLEIPMDHVLHQFSCPLVTGPLFRGPGCLSAMQSSNLQHRALWPSTEQSHSALSWCHDIYHEISANSTWRNSIGLLPIIWVHPHGPLIKCIYTSRYIEIKCPKGCCSMRLEKKRNWCHSSRSKGDFGEFLGASICSPSFFVSEKSSTHVTSNDGE